MCACGTSHWYQEWEMAAMPGEFDWAKHATVKTLQRPLS